MVRLDGVFAGGQNDDVVLDGQDARDGSNDCGGERTVIRSGDIAAEMDFTFRGNGLHRCELESIQTVLNSPLQFLFGWLDHGAGQRASVRVGRIACVGHAAWVGQGVCGGQGVWVGHGAWVGGGHGHFSQR